MMQARLLEPVKYTILSFGEPTVPARSLQGASQVLIRRSDANPNAVSDMEVRLVRGEDM